MLMSVGLLGLYLWIYLKYINYLPLDMLTVKFEAYGLDIASLPYLKIIN